MLRRIGWCGFLSLAAGQVAFQHDGSETLTADFSVSVEDGNQDLSNPASFYFS